MNRGNRSTRSTGSNKRRGNLTYILSRIVLIIVVLGLLAAAGTLVIGALGTTRGGFSTEAAPGLNPVQSVYLSFYLSSRQDELNTAIGSEAIPMVVEIEPGQGATDIANQLYALGIIADTELFLNYLTYSGIDRELDAGTYQMDSTMTIPEIASILAAGEVTRIRVQTLEGWRREQIADELTEQTDVPFTEDEVLAATQNADFATPALASHIPQGASLEGFLFPDTYQLEIDSTAADLASLMTATFAERVLPLYEAGPNTRGLTLYEVVTVASIVEREARIPEERATIASVYLNRYDIGMRLEADPTVQYAMGYQANRDEWWNLALTQADYYNVVSPYNTYLNEGLPPGPIASPGLGAIEAVLNPEDTPFYFFRATCDGSGYHAFAVTFEEHVANACP